MQNYRVLRGHEGDRPYVEGETRQADPAAVAHLVGKVLEPIKGKAEPSPKNKAEGAAPANKVITGRKAK
ncbi:MAG: hypothetical protein EOP19_17630 [Hyphomicrobiales bacterium]|nr:MAG: hypothetical protein EOP19_17630 [Hyphomicrobiales bacterium]